jgi:hypothetical protein
MMFAMGVDVMVRWFERPLVWSRVALIFVVCQAMSVSASGADLEQRTIDAYQRYVDEARDAFLRRGDAEEWTQIPSARGPAVVHALAPAETLPTGRIVKAPGGLIHHWAGVTFIPRADLRHVIDVAQAYDDYPVIYRSVLASRVIARDGDTFRVFARLKEDAGMVSAVLDVRTVVTYARDERRVYSLGAATEIREVKNAGAVTERLLPPGHDSGFLWRANTFTRFVERDSGVSVELETIGLSRRFPPLVGWLMEPIARRVGRLSVERTLAEFRTAVLAKEL